MFAGRYSYRYVSEIPLRGKGCAAGELVELTTTDEQGKVLYPNSFATLSPLE